MQIGTAVPRGTLLDLASRAVRRLAFEAWRRALGVFATLRAPNAREASARHNDFFFAELGVDRATAEAEYRRICTEIGLARMADDSIHFLAFAALKVAGFRPGTVLELGTATGETTAFLAALFDPAIIHTVELPDDDPIFRRFHGAGADRRAAAARLDRPNIRAHRVNTAFLSGLGLPDFDLIWLDAGHEFPEVAWDHAFCLGKLRKGGWLLSDDIRPSDNLLFRRQRGALDAFAVTEYLNERQESKFRYLLKREDPRLYVLDRKYVAVLHKTVQ